MGQISIALVDDHPLLRSGLAVLFGSTDGFEVVAQGSCAADAVEISSCFSPDILIMDLNMPGNAFTAISEINRKQKSTKVVAFTASAGIEHAVMALDAGARGYI